jgi:hypothetical protein
VSVGSRILRSTPYRDTVSTWHAIVELLTKGRASSARDELLSVVGVGSALIAEKAPESAAIVVTCDGPRTRIYCLYDEDAIDGGDAKEDALGYDALAGDWNVSLPCPTADLSWVQSELKAKSSRITARDQAATLGESTSQAQATTDDFVVDVEAFLK